jgi:hypothetical protein
VAREREKYRDNMSKIFKFRSGLKDSEMLVVGVDG